MSPAKTLNQDDIFKVANAIQGAVDAATRLRHGQALTQIGEFLATLLYYEKPYHWVSPGGFARISDLVFKKDAPNTDDVVRDFVLSVHQHFFVRWGEAGEKFTGLIDVLSWGLGVVGEGSVDDEPVEYTGMPSAIRERLSGQSDVTKLLKGNQWLVILILITSFVSITDRNALTQFLTEAPGTGNTDVIR